LWDFLEAVVWGFREENRGVGLWFSRKVFASGAGGNSLVRVAMCKYRRERERWEAVIRRVGKEILVHGKCTGR
jgi:hypothetical protein